MFSDLFEFSGFSEFSELSFCLNFMFLFVAFLSLNSCYFYFQIYDTIKLFYLRTITTLFPNKEQ